MTTKLTLKHKDSLALKGGKLYGEKRKYAFKEKMRWEEWSFSWLVLFMFVLYWFILMPLLWFVFHLTKNWDLLYWPFWIVAFVVWTAITCVVIVVWKNLEDERNREATLKYGSDHIEAPYSNIHPTTPERNGELVEMERMNNARDEESKKNDRNLPPLTIHKRASGEDEDGVANQIEKDEAQGSDIVDNCKDRPFQDNLKLVTVSSSEDEIKTPMSPRELFFIDLIREAEKAESAKSLKTKTHFFPTEDDTKDANDVGDAKENAQDTTDVKDENDEETSELRSKRQSSYFIANVESSADEKTEVFLQINSSAHEQIELSAEKPVLTLKSNEENSQEVSST